MMIFRLGLLIVVLASFLNEAVFAESSQWLATQPREVQTYLKALPSEMIEDRLPSRDALKALYLKLKIEPGDTPEFFYNDSHAAKVLKFAKRYMTSPGHYYFLGNGMVYIKHLIDEAVGEMMAESTIQGLPFSRDLIEVKDGEAKFRAYLKTSGILDQAAKGRVYLIDSSVGGNSLRYVQSALLEELKKIGIKEKDAMNRVVPIAISERTPNITLSGYRETADYLNDKNKKFSNAKTEHAAGVPYKGMKNVKTQIYLPLVVAEAFSPSEIERDYFAPRWTSPLSWNNSKYSTYDSNGHPRTQGAPSQYFLKPRSIEEAKEFIESRKKVLENFKTIDVALENLALKDPDLGTRLFEIYAQIEPVEKEAYSKNQYYGYKDGKHWRGEDGRKRLLSLIDATKGKSSENYLNMLTHAGIDNVSQASEAITLALRKEIVDWLMKKRPSSSAKKYEEYINTIARVKNTKSEQFLNDLWNDPQLISRRQKMASILAQALSEDVWRGSQIRRKVASDLFSIGDEMHYVDMLADASILGETPEQLFEALERISKDQWCRGTYSSIVTLAANHIKKFPNQLPATQESVDVLLSLSNMPEPSEVRTESIFTKAASDIEKVIAKARRLPPSDCREVFRKLTSP